MRDLKTDNLVQKYGCPCSSTDKYSILKYLGEGSFGVVAKCLKKRSNEAVAVKIGKSNKSQVLSKECSVLTQLKSNDPDKFNFVKIVENFIYRDHFFMVLEMLDQSLSDHMRAEGRRPLPMEGVRYITQQLLFAQNKLRDMNIMHGDLKPANIMLVNQQREPYRIKIIDFGCSILLPAKNLPLNLGTVHYRAPEIVLGIQYNATVDMFSTGCIVAKMLTGGNLYPSSSAYDHIRYIHELQGPFPDHMICFNEVAAQYFCRETEDGTNQSKWCIKTPEQYTQDTGKATYYSRKHPMKNLDSLLTVCSRLRSGYDESDADRENCVDLIKKMLHINHEFRISPRAALRCRFIECVHRRQLHRLVKEDATPKS